MKKGKKAAEVRKYDEEELDDLELPERPETEPRLVLKREPPDRKEQLMAHGVREIRCACCVQIRPIANAVEFSEGWICEDCFTEGTQEPKYGDQRGR